MPWQAWISARRAAGSSIVVIPIRALPHFPITHCACGGATGVKPKP